jgi:hypothetical protein
MTKSGPIESYVAELRRHLPPRVQRRQYVVDQISTQLRERADRHLWAALAHGDDISFEEAERHALLGFGPPAKVARSLAKAHRPGREKRWRWDSARAAAVAAGFVAVVLVSSAIALLGVDDAEPAPVDDAISDQAVAAAQLLPTTDMVEVEREGADGDSYEVEFLEANGDEVEVQLDGDFNMASVAAPGHSPAESLVARAQTAARNLSRHNQVHSVERGVSDGTYEVELDMAGSSVEVLLDSELNVVAATEE